MKLNLKKIFGEEVVAVSNVEDEFYPVSKEEASQNGEGSKLILVEPRAYSESQQIADHLKQRHTVVVNMKRVTNDQAKRIVDFLSGTIYAIGGDLQKLSGGIFLCAPNNMSIQGKMTEEASPEHKTKMVSEEE